MWGRVLVAVTMLSACGGVPLAAPLVAGSERFGRLSADETARVEAGLLLLGELGCVNCHAASGPALAHLAPKQAPVLDSVGKRLDPAWLSAYLADPRTVHPGTTMPDVLAGLSVDQRGRTAAALALYLASTGSFAAGSLPGSERGQVDAGLQLYERTGCAACHGTLRANATPLADQRSLGHLVGKWSPAELDVFLKDPTMIRPAGRMPAFQLSDGDRGHIVAALLGRRAGAASPFDTVVAFEGRAWRKLVQRLPDTATLGPPAQSGPVTGLDVFTLAGDRDEVVVELTGFFHALQAGTYAFHLGSDDGSRLTIGDATVVDHDGSHGHSEARGSIDLSAGVHSIRVAFFEAHGEESLAIDVVPPGGQRTSVLAFVTPTAEGQPAGGDADSTTLRPPDAALVDAGRAAFASVGCANCHRLDGTHASSASTTSGAVGPQPLAELARLGSGCLAEHPAAGAPVYGFDATQRAMLAEALAWLRSPAAAAPPIRERAIDRALTANNCYACHDRNGKGGVLPSADIEDEEGEPLLIEAARDALFVAAQAELGDEGRRPPTLTGVGGKLRPEFLRDVLAAGGRDRTVTMPTRMPKWIGAIAEPLANSLAADPPVTSPVPPLIGHAEREIVDQGRHLAGSKALGCIKCHSFAGDKGQSLGLIDMTRMPVRLQHGWFVAYTADPQSFRPGTRMPAAWPDGRTFYPRVLDGTAAGQIEAVWRYLSSPQPRPPVGVAQNLIELVPAGRPMIYRNFIEGAGPRGIGVGYPEGVHLAWDAEALRLALVWRGAFIDAGRHWTGRGAGWQPPLGDAVFTADTAAAIETLADAAASWPTEPPRSRGARFLGYALDAVGRPTFRWSLGGMTVEEKLEPAPSGPTLAVRRTIRLTGRPHEGTAIFRGASGRLEDEGDGWCRVDGLWKLRVSGPAAGAAFRHEAEGRVELRVPIVWKADGSADLVEELTW